MNKLIALIIMVFALAAASFVSAAITTTVPGHQQDRFDQDNNGYPDAGVEVNGHYNAIYAYDNSGNWYWNLGDGRVIGTVSSISDLNVETLTICEYNIRYRADFGNDPYMNKGWISQTIVCSGYDYPKTEVYMYLIVHSSDPRYTGNATWAIWGDWEYHILVESGAGNIARFTPALSLLKLRP